MSDFSLIVRNIGNPCLSPQKLWDQKVPGKGLSSPGVHVTLAGIEERLAGSFCFHMPTEVAGECQTMPENPSVTASLAVAWLRVAAP